jgi:hypothetical protein
MAEQEEVLRSWEASGDGRLACEDPGWLEESIMGFSKNPSMNQGKSGDDCGRKVVRGWLDVGVKAEHS